jgi:hypothetical protein
MLVTILLVGVFVAVTAMLARERLFAAMVMLLNVLPAATLATVWYEPLAAWLEGLMGRLAPPFSQFADMIAVWGIFAVVVGVARELTDRLGRPRVRFPFWLDLGGGVLVGAITAWIMVGFTATTLHMAALPREMVQPTPESRMLLGLAPDRKWLAWVRGSTINGPFAAGERRAFDPEADFVLRYGDRRAGNAAAFAGEADAQAGKP